MKEYDLIPQPFVIGVNYETCPSGQRDKLFLDKEARTLMRQKLLKAGLENILILSTCDRVEIIGLTYAPSDAMDAIYRYFAHFAPDLRRILPEVIFRYTQDDAMRHIFKICAALHSQMIGESQILGQVKEAYNEAIAAAPLSPDFDQFMQFSFNLAKRIRHQTKIGEGAISVASAGVKLGQDLHGDFKKRAKTSQSLNGIIYGLGEAGQILLDQFKVSGLSSWSMTGSARRTERVANRLECHYLPESDFQSALIHCDILITASGQGRFLLSYDDLKEIAKKRRYNPLLIIDCGIPYDMDTKLENIDSIFLYRLEDLEKIASRGQNNREQEAMQAREMVAEAVIEYRRFLAEKEGIPALVSLREHFDKTRQDVLENNPHLNAQEATRLLVNKLLHTPSEALRTLAGDGKDADLRDWITVNRVLGQLFGLNASDSLPLKSNSEKN